MDEGNSNLSRIRAVCGNKKCRDVSKDPAIEFNFFTGEIIYICPSCGQDSKISLRVQAAPLPKTRMGLR